MVTENMILSMICYITDSLEVAIYTENGLYSKIADILCLAVILDKWILAYSNTLELDMG